MILLDQQTHFLKARLGLKSILLKSDIELSDPHGHWAHNFGLAKPYQWVMFIDKVKRNKKKTRTNTVGNDNVW